MAKKRASGLAFPPSRTPSVEDATLRDLETEFLALISHELRSPLTVIKGYAATLRRASARLDASERDEYLRAIGEACDRLDTTIARLLELAQLEAGVLEPHLEPVDMLYLLREAMIAAEQRWGVSALGSDGHFFIPPDHASLPLALADQRLQREALDIVLENAARFSPAGSVIWATARVTPAYLVLTAHDQGPGIAPSRQRLLFERFSGLDTRLARASGLGIGLAMCKRIMRLQGGDIWVESEPGMGSAFSLSLPLANP